MEGVGGGIGSTATAVGILAWQRGSRAAAAGGGGQRQQGGCNSAVAALAEIARWR